MVMTHFQIGDISVDRIVEMVSPFETIPIFFPNAGQDQIEACKLHFEPWAVCPETGKIILVVQSFLLRTQHHTIVIDTCVGCNKTVPFYSDWNKRTDQTWLEKLAKAGVSVADVDFVFCTHLHCDHVGWNTQMHNGRWRPTFPNAKYIISVTEFEQAQKSQTVGYKENVLPIVETGQAEIVESDYVLNDHIWLEPLPGHTPGQVAVAMESKGVRAVMCADVAHSPIQCLYPHWNAMSDDDPHQAETTRRRFFSENCDSGRIVMTAHFPEPSVGRIVNANHAFRFEYLS